MELSNVQPGTVGLCLHSQSLCAITVGHLPETISSGCCVEQIIRVLKITFCSWAHLSQRPNTDVQHQPSRQRSRESKASKMKVKDYKTTLTRTSSLPHSCLSSMTLNVQHEVMSEMIYCDNSL